MILQYDDIVLQVVARLQAVIPQTPVKVANVIIMQNPAQQIADFFNKSSEQSQIMVTYSGNTTEGYRRVEERIESMGQNTQRLAHTIEVHLCTKRYMAPTVGALPNSMLQLMWAVRAGLVGLKMYQRDVDGNVIYQDMAAASDGGMFYLEGFVDMNYPGVVCVCRFQVMETVGQADMENAADIWGQYKQITLQEYMNQEGTPGKSDSGEPDAVVVIPES